MYEEIDIYIISYIIYMRQKNGITEYTHKPNLPTSYVYCEKPLFCFCIVHGEHNGLCLERSPTKKEHKRNVMAAVWEPKKSTIRCGSQAAATRARTRDAGTLRGCVTVVLFGRYS